MHDGYTSEKVRRKRFDRNLPLLQRNIEDYPDRHLDKLLLLRDYAQMCQFELEKGFPVTTEMLARADRGIALWDELIEVNTRMALDSLQYYSILVRIKQEGFEVKGALAIQRDVVPSKGEIDITGRYLNKNHLSKVVNAITFEKVKNYDKKYF